MSGLDDEVLLCVFGGESTNPTDSIRYDECSEMYPSLCCQVDVECHLHLLSLTSFLGWTSVQPIKFKMSVPDLANELKQLRSSVPLAIKSLMNRSEATTDRQTSLCLVTQADTAPSATTPTTHGSIVAADPATLLTVNIDSRAPSQPAPPMQYSDVVRLVTKTIALFDRRKLNLIVTGLPEPNPSFTTDVKSFTKLASIDLQYDTKRL